MAVAIPSKDEITNDNIRVGLAELIAVKHRGKTYWELPGGGRTSSRPHAMDYARRLDQMIRRNQERTGQSLLWS